MSKSKNVVKKLTMILFTILFTLVPVFAIGPTNVNAETTDITEINLTGNYQYGTVPAGVLPAFNPGTTTEGASIGTGNGGWAKEQVQLLCGADLVLIHRLHIMMAAQCMDTLFM